MSAESIADDTADRSDSDGTKSSTTLEQDVDQPKLDVDHGPPRLSQALGFGAGVLGMALTAPFAGLAIPFGLAGILMLAFSLFGSYAIGWLTVGTAMILLGSLIAGASGVVSPELMLVAVGATIFAWDVGQHGIVLGDQIGRQSQTDRAVAVHAAATALIVGLVSGWVYLVYLFGGDGYPASAVSIVVVGIVIVAWVYRS